MTVAELIERLQLEDLDAPVIIAVDPEGYAYIPLEKISTGYYIENRNTDNDLTADGPGEYVLCIWPHNYD